MTNRLLKIVVLDSAGEEHIFNESPGQVEHYLDIRPTDDQNEVIPNLVKITSRTWGTKFEYETEEECLFILPRKINVLWENS